MPNLSVMVDRLKLLDACQSAAKVVKGRTSLPILEHLKLTMRNDRLSVSGTDLEVWIEISIAPSDLLASDGEITLPASIIVPLLTAMQGSSVSIRAIESNAVSVECGKSKTKVLGFNPAEFPEMPVVDTANASVCILASDLSTAIKQTVIATSQDATHYILQGVAIQTTDDKLAFIGCDRYSLAVRTLETHVEGSVSAVVMNTHASRLASILPGSGTATMEFFEKQSRTKWVDGDIAYTFVTRLIDGQYIDWRKYLDALSVVGSYDVDLKSFRSAFAQAKLFDKPAAGQWGCVFFVNGEGDAIEMHSQNGYIGESTASVDVRKSGELPQRVGFTPGFISEVLGVIATDDLYVEMLKSAKDDYAICLMPADGTGDYRCSISAQNH